mmetsp:Transcript_66844/g.172092  ORF Transcript_66844/g.172092 Transcript_66844/m.172092 type:complete len:181 (+) Transcript_66844:71-613(+)
MSLSRTCARFAFRRSAAPLAGVATKQPSIKPLQAFGYGEVAPGNAPGFGEAMEKPPETVKDTVKYISKGMTNVPKWKEVVEAIGYPGQKHSSGAITTVNRIYYGPGRYDYGRVTMPTGWFANWFYGFWEFGHLFWVADRWIAMRQLRHILGVGCCFFPFWLQSQWNQQAWDDYKRSHAGQ